MIYWHLDLISHFLYILLAEGWCGNRRPAPPLGCCRRGAFGRAHDPGPRETELKLHARQGLLYKPKNSQVPAQTRMLVTVVPKPTVLLLLFISQTDVMFTLYSRLVNSLKAWREKLGAFLISSKALAGAFWFVDVVLKTSHFDAVSYSENVTRNGECHKKHRMGSI